MLVPLILDVAEVLDRAMDVLVEEFLLDCVAAEDL